MARFQIAPGPVPLHHQVYQDLRAALDDREWAAGDRLPTERELARRYGCSLITVRRALDELRREHRLTRTQGRGTFVSQPAIERDLLGSASFNEEMTAAGLEPETRTVTARKEPASERVAQALGLRLGAPTIYLERRASACAACSSTTSRQIRCTRSWPAATAPRSFVPARRSNRCCCLRARGASLATFRVASPSSSSVSPSRRATSRSSTARHSSEATGRSFGSTPHPFATVQAFTNCNSPMRHRAGAEASRRRLRKDRSDRARRRT